MAAEHEIITTPGLHEFFSFINVAIVLAAVIFLARTAIIELFKNRSLKIREDLILAREELKKISQEIEVARNSLANIAQEKAALVLAVETEGKALALQLVEEARASAVRIREDAGRAVTAEFADVRAKLKSELMDSMVAKVRAEFANEGARQKLHDKLIENFLNNVGELKRDSQGSPTIRGNS